MLVDPFEYAETRRLTEAEYSDIHAIYPRRKRRWRAALVAMVAIACLFNAYTLLAGILVLVLLGLALVAPRLLPGGLSSLFREHTHLHQELTFRVTDQSLSVTGANLDLRCDWSNLARWHEREGWLRLMPSGMQDLYLRVDGLESAGLFDRVMELCRAHGLEFDAPGPAA